MTILKKGKSEKKRLERGNSEKGKSGKGQFRKGQFWKKGRKSLENKKAANNSEK